MKRLARAGLSSDAIVYRFLAEAQITSQLEHPGILPVFDVGVDPEGFPFYTTQLLRGTRRENASAVTLADIWRRCRDGDDEWPFNKALSLLVSVCSVLAHAHSRGVIHRDLKPTNVLVGSFEDVRVIDWGSARVLPQDAGMIEASLVPLNYENIETDRAEALCSAGGAPNTTARAGLPITLLYAPPELLDGRLLETGPQTDTYAIGVMLYEFISGRPPYSDGTAGLPPAGELRSKILAGAPMSLRLLAKRASRDLIAICERAMARTKETRYASMSELQEDLRAALELRPVKARKPGPVLIAHRWCARHPGLVIGLVAAIIIASVAFFVSRGLRAQRDLARSVAAVTEAVTQAELAEQSGNWKEALRFWSIAESSGYRENVQLGLHRAEAFTVLNEPGKAKRELQRLLARSDLGTNRGTVLLRAGAGELFDEATAAEGVKHVREAIASGLNHADGLYATGLLAHSSSDALAFFDETLRWNPRHHGAYQLSLGLGLLLGRHGEVADRLKAFRVFFPEDFSGEFIAASELALAQKLPEAEASIRPAIDNLGGAQPRLLPLLPSLKLLAESSGYYSPETFLSADREDRLNNVTWRALEIFGGAWSDQGLKLDPQYRIPQMPCVQEGLREAMDAIRPLANRFATNLDACIRRLQTSWEKHSEALVPFTAATLLESRHPPGGQRSRAILSRQAELFSLAARSTSMYPKLLPLAQYLAARAKLELVTRDQSQKEIFQTDCIDLLRKRLEGDKLTVKECEVWYPLAMQLGQTDSARQIVQIWGAQAGLNKTLRQRAEVEIAAGAIGPAVELIQEILFDSPSDEWANTAKQKLLETARAVGKRLEQTATK